MPIEYGLAGVMAFILLGLFLRNRRLQGIGAPVDEADVQTPVAENVETPAAAPKTPEPAPPIAIDAPIHVKHGRYQQTGPFADVFSFSDLESVANTQNPSPVKRGYRKLSASHPLARRQKSVMDNGWIEVGNRTAEIEFNDPDDCLIMVWDDASGTPPQLALAPDQANPDVTHITLNGIEVASVAGRPGLTADDIRLVAQSLAQSGPLAKIARLN